MQQYPSMQYEAPYQIMGQPIKSHHVKAFIVTLLILTIIGIVVTLIVLYVKKSKVPPASSPPVSPPPPPQPEVFGVSCGAGYSNGVSSVAAAAQMCSNFGATLASQAQVTGAASAGGSWCSAGYTSDGSIGWPSDGLNIAACGPAGFNVGASPACANCYGIKPPQGTNNVLPWNTTTNAW